MWDWRMPREWRRRVMTAWREVILDRVVVMWRETGCMVTQSRRPRGRGAVRW
jgi:hypothetical protein